MPNRRLFLTSPVKPLVAPLIGAVLLAASTTWAEPSPASAQTATTSTGSGLTSSEPQELIPRTRPTEREFYGWEILLIGETGGLVAAAAVELPSSQFTSQVSTFFFLFGMPAYVLGGPIAHWSHNDFTKGLVSLGVNLVAPAVAGVIGGGVRCGAANPAADCSAKGFFDGLAVAVVTVPLLDAFILGWENVPIDDQASPDVHASAGVRRERGAIVATPIVGVTPRGVTLGLSGRF